MARAGPVLEQGLALEGTLEVVEQAWAREQEQEQEPDQDQERMEADLFIRGQGLPSIRVRAPVQLQAVELPAVVRGASEQAVSLVQAVLEQAPLFLLAPQF